MRTWLKELRVKQHLTQKEVAKLVGISRVFYTQIENGYRRPSPEKSQKIAKELEFDWKKFFEF